MLMSYWSTQLSHFITKHKIHHLYLSITTHDDFDSADSSSMQHACHVWMQLKWPSCSPWVLVAQIECPSCVRRSWVRLPLGLRFFLCPILVSYWSTQLSHFSTEHKIHHLYSLITIHDDFDSAHPSSMQDACHTQMQLNELVALHGFS